MKCHGGVKNHQFSRLWGSHVWRVWCFHSFRVRIPRVDPISLHFILYIHMGVSKNSGTPKWMVYTGQTLLKWMIMGGYHNFRNHPYTSNRIQQTKANHEPPMAMATPKYKASNGFINQAGIKCYYPKHSMYYVYLTSTPPNRPNVGRYYMEYISVHITGQFFQLCSAFHSLTSLVLMFHSWPACSTCRKKCVLRQVTGSYKK